MPVARRRRMMAERAAEGEDAEAEDVPMVESIENLEDTRGRPVREHITAVGPRTECANRFKGTIAYYVRKIIKIIKRIIKILQRL